MKLSIRLPPHVVPQDALKAFKEVLEKDPPCGAHVSFDSADYATGWESPVLVDWLEAAVTEASTTFFKKPLCYVGEGGTIPFMQMLGDKFPSAQFVITGVLGPQANAHGPNEFLHIDYTKKITGCVAMILEKHALKHNK